MATRAQVLADPRSGAAEGAGRPGRPARPAPDQRSRDELAASRARSGKKAASTRPPGRPDAAQVGPEGTSAPATRRRAPAATRRPAAPEPESAAAPEGAAAPEAAPAPAASSSPRSFATDGAGAFLALLVYPFVVNYLRGGMPRAVGWIKAKWLNKPYGGAAPASSGKVAAVKPLPGMSGSTAHLVTGGHP